METNKERNRALLADIQAGGGPTLDALLAMDPLDRAVLMAAMELEMSGKAVTESNIRKHLQI
jgi:hypothetical protein